MFLALFLTCFVGLVVSTVLLLTLGKRTSFSSRAAGLVLGLAVAAGSGELTARIWHVRSADILIGEMFLLGAVVVMVAVRPQWNPIGQLFFGAFLASILAYLGFAIDITLARGLPLPDAIGSALLLLLELIALTLSASFAFESCDVICRTRPSRPAARRDPSYRPMVSLQIAAYNEPPDMLLETIKSAEALRYPNFEIVVIDNNTKDPDVWRPVEEYCRDRPRVKFVHVDPWPGYKSGALNLALTEYTSPDAELVGVIDADYLVDPEYLDEVVGYFADPNLAFVQTPQDYREYEGDAYLTACYDAYRYFFASSMPSRNQRNSIIFCGTMGLLRRSALEQLGGWDEWCITEDAETSLRVLKMGYSGLYLEKSYGHGVMPLTFAALKSQRFRWCFGGMQILRQHWRELMLWNRDPDNHLTPAQRVDYFLGGIQWLNDLVYLAFSLVLLITGALLIAGDRLTVRPLLGAAVLLPSALIASGLLRALWALRQRTGIGTKRALLAFCNWMSMSWTVALACLLGLTRSEGVFLRTPKTDDDSPLLATLWVARAETLMAGLLLGIGVAAALSGQATAFVLALFAWQAFVYACSPYMAWLNQHTKLSAQLERRRRTEDRREQRAAVPYFVGASVGLAAVVAIAAIVGIGGSRPYVAPRNPFAVPHASSGDHGPLSNLIKTGSVTKPATPSSTTPSSTPSGGGPGTTGPGSPPTSGSPTTGPNTTTPNTTVPPGTTTVPTTVPGPTTTGAAAH